MKQTVFKIILSFVMALIVNVANAADQPSWVYSASVEKLHVQPNGNVYVTIGKVVPNLGCNIYRENILQLNTAAANFQQQYALMLSALMGNKNVEIHVNGCGDAYAYASNTNLLK